MKRDSSHDTLPVIRRKLLARNPSKHIGWGSLDFDNECHTYKVRPGFKFPAIQTAAETESGNSVDSIVLLANAKKILAEGERFFDSLRQLISCLEGFTEPPTK